MFLFEKGIEVNIKECITTSITLRNDYRDSYVHDMVPMLELDDSTQLGEGLSIWLYLEALHPEPLLMGETALKKATISAWERRAYDEGMVGHAEILCNSHPDFIDRGLPGYRDPIPQVPALVDRGKRCGARFHKRFNDQLANNRFVAGNKFTVADITTICVVDMGHAIEMQIPDSDPHVKRWYDEVKDRHGVYRRACRHICQMARLCLSESSCVA